MEHFSDNREFDLYRDINTRTNGEIYIGVVGPVRTGKSTFIKRFMDLMVLPFMEDEHARERTIDELPQSAAGKTIMTTEPKFIPQEAAEIILPELPGSSAGMPQPALSQSVLPGTAIQGSAAQPKIKVRLIDCVGAGNSIYDSCVDRYSESDPGSCNDRNRCDDRWHDRGTAAKCICKSGRTDGGGTECDRKTICHSVKFTETVQ